MADFDPALDFTRKILKNLDIASYIITPEDLAGLSLDNHLRDHLLEGYDAAEIFGSFLRELKEETVYFSQDQFSCRYTMMKLPSCEKPVYFIAGPYLLQRPDRYFLLDLQQNLDIPARHIPFLNNYYHSLPMIEFEDYLRSIFLLLAAELYGGDDRFAISYCRGILDDPGHLRYTPTVTESDNLDLLEKRYESENELLQSVSSGNYQKIELMLSGFISHPYKQRLTNLLRDQKNHLIIFNSLLRKAAEAGGVHPFYLDDISSQFALKIEQISGDHAYRTLASEMPRRYCLLVQSYSTKGYSPIIQKVMNYIPQRLTEDLSLKTLAARFSISPTYLSASFKKETGSTLTDFVNKKRVEHALFLLNSTDLYIQTIAADCGIPDLNYFTKVFKKYTGKTPREYRSMIQQS